jgi:hypothetical protein
MSYTVNDCSEITTPPAACHNNEIFGIVSPSSVCLVSTFNSDTLPGSSQTQLHLPVGSEMQTKEGFG